MNTEPSSDILQPCGSLIPYLKVMIREWQSIISKTVYTGFVYRFTINDDSLNNDKEYIGFTLKPVEWRIIEHITNPLSGKLIKILKDKSRNDIVSSVIQTIEESDYTQMIIKTKQAEAREIDIRKSIENGWNSVRGSDATEMLSECASKKYSRLNKHCKHCSMRFRKYWEHVIHLYLAHQEGENPFQCKPCKLSFQDAESLFIHNTEKHFSSTLCNVCRIPTVMYYKAFYWHMFFKHGIQGLVFKTGHYTYGRKLGFKCQYNRCDFWTASTYILHIHRWEIHNIGSPPKQPKVKPEPKQPKIKLKRHSEPKDEATLTVTLAMAQVKRKRGRKKSKTSKTLDLDMENSE